MKFTKFAIFLILILSLIAAGMTAYLSTVRENEKEKRITLQKIRMELEDQVNDLENTKLELQRKVESMNSELSETKASLQALQATNAQLTQQLTGKDQTIQSKESELKELQQAIRLSQDRNRELEGTLDRLERALEQMKKAHLEATGQMMRTEVEGADYSTMAEPYIPPASSSPESRVPVEALFENPAAAPKQESKKEKKEQKKSITSDMPAAETAAGKEAAASSESIQAGRVLLVNRKFNFVVINVGSKQGIQAGDSFQVLNAGERVANVEVEKLYDDFAAAKIVEQFGDRSLLKEGNLVTTM